MISHVKTVGIMVRDQQRALDFCVNVLGFGVRRDGPYRRRCLYLDANGCCLRRPVWSIDTFADIAYERDDIELTKAPTLQPWGSSQTIFRDVDDNTFVLVPTARRT